LRIAYVSADRGVPVFGSKGCSIHVQQVLRAWLAKGVEAELFTASLGGAAPLDLRGIPVHELDRSDAHGVDRELQAISANGTLGRRLLRSAAFDAIYERLSLFGFAGMEVAQRLGVPGILEVNAPLVEEQLRHRRLIDVTSAYAALRRALRAARHIVAVSDAVASYLEGFEEAAGKVVVVPNGADVQRIRPLDAKPASGGTFTVGFVGSLKPWHALDIVVEAAAEVATSLPELRLQIVGDGPCRDALEAATQRAGLERHTHFVGAVAPDRIPAELRRMDVGIAPYADGPGCYFSPLKVFEYMAAGLPVVATRAGQLTRVVQDGASGILCEPGSASDWVEALLQLGGRPALRDAMGRAGRQRAIEEYSWDRVADRLLALAIPQPIQLESPLAIAAG